MKKLAKRQIRNHEMFIAKYYSPLKKGLWLHRGKHNINHPTIEKITKGEGEQIYVP